MVKVFLGGVLSGFYHVAMGLLRCFRCFFGWCSEWFLACCCGVAKVF